MSVGKRLPQQILPWVEIKGIQLLLEENSSSVSALDRLVIVNANLIDVPF